MISRHPFAGVVFLVLAGVTFAELFSHPHSWAKSELILIGAVILISTLHTAWAPPTLALPAVPSKPDPEVELYMAMVALKMERERDTAVKNSAPADRSERKGQ